MQNHRGLHYSRGKSLLLLLCSVVLGGLALLSAMIPIVRADSPIFVRPQGSDLHCSGNANIDYSSEVAPYCAVQTGQRALKQVDAGGEIILPSGARVNAPIVTAGGVRAPTTLFVSKSDSPDPVTVNSALTYTIFVTNTGAATATNVELVDFLPLPGIVTFNSVASTQGVCQSLGGSIISCTLGQLDIGLGAMVTIVVTPTAAGTIRNFVGVQSTNPSGDSDDETTSVTGITNLSLSKMDFPDPVPIGNPLTYTITVTNSGPSAAANVTMTDQLPPGATFSSATPSQGTPCTHALGVVTCELGLMGANTTATVSIVVIPNAAGVITNTANITGGGLDLDTSNNVATETTTVVPFDLIITKTATITAPSFGKVTTFTVEYENAGTFTASNVVITDFLDTNIEYVTDTLGITPITTPTTVRWNLNDVGPGQNGTFDIGVRPTVCPGSSLVFTNAVRIDSNIIENDGDNFDQAGPVTVPCGLVDLVVIKNDGVGASDPITEVVAGGTISYTISVNNVGDQTATNVVLTETLPANTIFVGPVGVNGWFQVGVTNQYIYNVGSLLSGQGQVIPFEVQVNPALSCSINQVINTAQVDSDGPEADSSDNIVNEQTPVVCNLLAGNLQVHKDDGLICAAPNQTVTYTITYSNSGAAPVNNVFLTEFQPTYTNFLPGGVNAGWVDTGGGIFTRALGSVPVGGPFGPVQYQVQVVGAGSIPAGVTSITNVVQISGGDTFTEVTSLPLVPDLAVAKNDNIGVTSFSSEFVSLYQRVSGSLPALGSQALDVGPGDIIDYTIVYVNNGRATATGVVMTDTLPLYTDYVGGPEWTNAGGRSYVHNIGTLNPGQGTFLSFRVQVTNSLPISLAWIINQVEISGNESGLECNLGNSVSFEQTPVNPSATLVPNVFLPIILQSDLVIPPSPPPPPLPVLRSYVSDVAADPDTNQIFIASPRHDWVYVISGSSDTVTRNVPVGVGPTGLTVLDAANPADNKVFVAHQYGANNWRPGVKAFGVNETGAHNTADTGYAGAAPVKIVANASNNSRVYVSNFFDKLAVVDGNSGPPENRLGWVEQKGYQGAYGIDISSSTNRVYLATRDSGELVVFDGNSDQLLNTSPSPGYIPTHVKPPEPCSLWSVVVNETTGHVIVPCPQLSKVFVFEESQISARDLDTLGVLERRNGSWARVVDASAAPWLAAVPIPNSTGVGEEGIAVDPTTNRVFITNAQNNSVVILQDGTIPAFDTSVSVGLYPQGVDVNPVSQKLYVGETGSNTVTVLQATSPYSVVTTIPLTP